MIRINLLQEGRRPVVARRAKAKLSLGRQDPAVLILAAGILLGALVAAGSWYREHSRIEEKNAQIARAEAEVRELDAIIKKVESFKQQKASLENRIAVIQELKRKQRGPVQVMDRVSRALPDLLWLDKMSMQGTTVTVDGMALNTNAVAGFIGNLNTVPEFREPDTKDIRSMRRAGQNAFSFKLVFTFEQQEDDAEDELAVGP